MSIRGVLFQCASTIKNLFANSLISCVVCCRPMCVLLLYFNSLFHYMSVFDFQFLVTSFGICNLSLMQCYAKGVS
jgi:hypothetical protein